MADASYLATFATHLSLALTGSLQSDEQLQTETAAEPALMADS
jgi:hypothetical protein